MFKYLNLLDNSWNIPYVPPIESAPVSPFFLYTVTLKGKFKKEKRVSSRKSLLKLGAKKTLSSDKEMTKSDSNNLPQKQTNEGIQQTSSFTPQYSSDWETDEDDMARQSSDEMEDL